MYVADIFDAVIAAGAFVSLENSIEAKRQDIIDAQRERCGHCWQAIELERQQTDG